MALLPKLSSGTGGGGIFGGICNVPPKGLSGPNMALAGLALELWVLLEVKDPPFDGFLGRVGCWTLE